MYVTVAFNKSSLGCPKMNFKGEMTNTMLLKCFMD